MISKKTFMASVLMMAAAAVTASAKDVTVTRSFRNFNEIEVHDAVSVVYCQSKFGSSEHTLIITADEKIIGNVITGQKGEKVTIKMKKSKDKNMLTREVRIVVKAPALTDIELSGASSLSSGRIFMDQEIEISAKGASTVDISQLKAADIDVEASGASTIKLGSVNTDYLKVEAEGASNVLVSGRAVSAEYEASGASSIKAPGLRAQRGSATAKGASTVVSSIANPTCISNTGASSVKNR